MMLIAYYDLAMSPPTFDFVTFLLVAERERRKRNNDGVAISILPGPVDGFRSSKFWPFSVAERVHTLHRIVVPMAHMLPSVREVTLRQDRPPRPDPWSIGLGCSLYGTKLFVECMRAGLRPLRPPEDRKRDDRLITITLREAEHWPQRNSNVEEWIAAAHEIRRSGFRVVIVRDTLQAGTKIDGLETDALAATDLVERAQLYRSARCNLFVNNGPAWLAMALDAPVLIMRPTVDGVSQTSSSTFFRECGISPGGQIPGAPIYQRLVWQDDTADRILAALDAFKIFSRAA